MTPASIAICVAALFLSPLAFAGIALINTGLGRSRSAAHCMLASLCVFGVASLACFACGFAIQGSVHLPSYEFVVAGKEWNWIGAQGWFLRGVNLQDPQAGLSIWMQIAATSVAALIPLGAGMDRWRLSAICASTALLVALVYALFAHWVWGGWLSQLGVNFGLGHGFLDAGGSSSIHAVGGLAALAIAWICGPRRGKYPPNGRPAVIPGHHAVFVLFGCLLALAGWLGLNAAGSILYMGAGLESIPLVAINTLLAASAGGLSAAALTRIRFQRPDASLTANGWVAGLVATSAGCLFVAPGEAIVVGSIAGALVIFSVELLELRLFVDDPGGAISVHGGAGIWGVFAAGLFARFPARAINGVTGDPAGQWLAQLIGIATLLGFVLPLAYTLNLLLNRLHPQRVSVEAERLGLDLHELGGGAYPDFPSNDDYAARRF
ncbi:ammonium transporter [Nevskia soli]|uniref:ammonium transporter n=1 Tax=Nevskia soli TaxID=418856 RepID=UPI0015D858E8|nr:ammonium transporter [Nevskia soli]